MDNITDLVKKVELVIKYIQHHIIKLQDKNKATAIKYIFNTRIVSMGSREITQYNTTIGNILNI